jgi:hypothetical protein
VIGTNLVDRHDGVVERATAARIVLDQKGRIRISVAVGIAEDRIADDPDGVLCDRTRLDRHLGNTIGQGECLAVNRDSKISDFRRGLPVTKDIATVSEIEADDTGDRDSTDKDAKNRHRNE